MTALRGLAFAIARLLIVYARFTVAIVVPILPIVWGMSAAERWLPEAWRDAWEVGLVTVCTVVIGWLLTRRAPREGERMSALARAGAWWMTTVPSRGKPQRG
jgi:hypothetical protein